MREQIDRSFRCLIGVFVLFQICLGLNDTKISSSINSNENRKISSVVKPKEYLIGKLAPLFAGWCAANGFDTAQKINKIFGELGINAELLANTIKFCNGSYEFLVYIPKYKKDFLFRYTPLMKDIARIVKDEGFRLEVKLFSNWKIISIDQLFV